MNVWLLTFFLGAILSLFLPEVPAIFQLFSLLFLSIAFLLFKILRISSGLLLGACWILTQAYLYQSQLNTQVMTLEGIKSTKPFIDLMLNKDTFYIEGEVLTPQVEMKDESSSGDSSIIKNTSARSTSSTVRFNFKVSKINGTFLRSEIMIRLSWQKSPFVIAQGQYLSLKVKLKPAHGLANIGSFNYLSWLTAHNIIATGYVVNTKKVMSRQTPVFTNQLIENTFSFRQILLNDYQKLIPNHPLNGIILALAFGERSLLDKEHWRVLQTTGTSHLIAISGLHVGLLATGVFFITMVFLRSLPIKDHRWQRFNIHYIAIAMSLLFATLYAYLAGFSLPTQRALIMLMLYWCSRLLHIKLSIIRLLLITLFITVIISPFSLFTASFWLSFYAVSIIFLSLWRFRYWLNQGAVIWRFIKGLFVIQIALTVMLIPVSAFFFPQLSLVSLLANLIAVPWMSFISIPSALLSVVFIPISEVLSQFFISLSLQSLQWLWHYLDKLSRLPHAMVILSFKQQIGVLLAGIAIFIPCYVVPLSWFISKGKAYISQLNILSNKLCFYFVSLFTQLKVALLTLAILLLLLPIYWGGQTVPKETVNLLSSKQNNTALSHASAWRIIFFDVGQGLSVLILSNDHAILYDTGASYPSGFILSEAVVIPYLKHLGITTLDKVIISHSDNDHAGGLTALIEQVSIDAIMSNDETLGDDTSNKNTSIKPPFSSCYQGQQFNWQGLTIDVLWPIKTTSSGLMVSKQGNDDSCVLLVTDTWGNKVLLTGDISSKVEQQLLVQYPHLTVDVLQVPHHGSKTSSSQTFIKQLLPQYAVVSAGYLNRWNMPVADVSQRYYNENITLLNNAILGQIIISFDNNGINSQSYNETLRPFWFLTSNYQ